jgi:hypothetical protein
LKASEDVDSRVKNTNKDAGKIVHDLARRSDFMALIAFKEVAHKKAN